MRDHEDRAIALECLRLAISAQAIDPIDIAGRMLAFVTGTDGDDSKAKLAAVREVVG